MKFFVPFADDEAQAERVFAAFAEFNNVAVPSHRIYGLTWSHKGQEMDCRVGWSEPLTLNQGGEFE